MATAQRRDFCYPHSAAAGLSRQENRPQAGGLAARLSACFPPAFDAV